MIRTLLALFTLTSLVSAQAHAWNCAIFCDQKFHSSHTMTQSQGEESHTCHKSAKESPTKGMADGCCSISVCAMSVSDKPASSVPLNDTQSVSKVIVRDQNIKLQSYPTLPPVTLAYSKIPLPQKIRLHLRLRRLLN